MTARIEINDGLYSEIEAELRKLEMIGRHPALKKGLRAAGKTVEKRCRSLLPKPGYPGDKPELKPLRDTLKTKINEYQDGRVLVASTGYEWGAGSHGHMVEEGHEIVVGGTSPKVGKGRKTARKSKRTGFRGMGRSSGFVEGKHYLALAAEATTQEQGSAIVDSLRSAAEDATQG